VYSAYWQKGGCTIRMRWGKFMPYISISRYLQERTQMSTGRGVQRGRNNGRTNAATARYAFFSYLLLLPRKRCF
jgi:hypothetical protein